MKKKVVNKLFSDTQRDRLLQKRTLQSILEPDVDVVAYIDEIHELVAAFGGISPPSM